jgi:ribonuclease D
MPLPAGLPLTIAREQLLELPVCRYEGPVVMVETQATLARALEAIRAETVTGFDTETRPAFRPGERYAPCLAQVATAHAVWLFPLERLDCSAVLAEFLGARGIIKAGVALADDLRQLKERFPFTEHGIRDLGAIARRHGLKQSGVRNLAALFLGARITKGTKTSNWAARQLSPQQVSYAATDAWICRELWLRFDALGLTAPVPDAPAPAAASGAAPQDLPQH